MSNGTHVVQLRSVLDSEVWQDHQEFSQPGAANKCVARLADFVPIEDVRIVQRPRREPETVDIQGVRAGMRLHAMLGWVLLGCAAAGLAVAIVWWRAS